MSEKILELIGITKDYIQGTHCLEILNDLKLEIPKGKSVSIMGESGEGKSTLLQIMGLLDSKFAGNILFNGTSVKSLSEREKEKLRLNKIGFIYQYHHLLRDFSARENIAMSSLINGDNFDAALENADNLLKKVNLYDRRFHFPGKLSGGEQQRVAVLRALANNPDIILADEPTGNLDGKNSNIVIDLLLNLSKETKTSLVMVTHNKHIADLCDIRLELSEGKLH